jgi:hypothetical protein
MRATQVFHRQHPALIRYLEKTSISGMLIVDIEGFENPESELDDLAPVCPPDTDRSGFSYARQ